MRITYFVERKYIVWIDNIWIFKVFSVFSKIKIKSAKKGRIKKLSWFKIPLLLIIEDFKLFLTSGKVKIRVLGIFRIKNRSPSLSSICSTTISD